MFRSAAPCLAALFAGLAIAAPAARAAVSVTATVETDPVHHALDAADDAAVWVHPTNTALSTIIGTDKLLGGGLLVYDLSGRELSFVPDDRVNNVDLRYNFPLGGRLVSLVGATNRDNGRIDFWTVQADRTLTAAGSVATSAAIVTPRGFAMYHSPVTGTYYAFVTDRGHTDQYELSGASGTVTGRLVRQLQLIPNATEGLVADDELARVYVAEEDIGGIWRFGAEPGDATTGVKIDSTTEVGGHIVQDVKGLSMSYAGGHGGFLVAASQGGDSFHVYNRGDNTWRGEFQILDGPLTDKVTAIDGIDVSSFALGPRFPFGVFVSQDDANPGADQNYKLVPWESIAQALGLGIDNTFDPRLIGLPDGAPPPPPSPAPARPSPPGGVPVVAGGAGTHVLAGPVVAGVSAPSGAARPGDAPGVRAEIASLRNVSARLSYRRVGRRGFAGLRLEIVRAGARALDETLARTCPVCSLRPVGEGRGGAVRVVDLDGDGEPEVVVDLLRVDGARMSVIHRFRPAGGDYGEVVRVWGRTAERIADLDRDGTAELVAGDVRFPGLGSPSVLPARIWQLRGEAVTDVTPRFGTYLTAGATRLYARSRTAARRGTRRFARGVLAAAVAQDYVAGQARRADRRVAAALARGDLRPQRGEPRSAGGRAYVRRLHALLARVGYAS